MDLDVDADRSIVHTALGELGDNDETLAINAEVELPPAPAFVRCLMFVRMPLTITDHLQPSRVDDEMDWTVVVLGKHRDHYVAISPRERRMVGRLQVEPHQTDQRGHKALGLTESEVEHHAQGQRGHDREVGIPTLAAGSTTGWLVPPWSAKIPSQVFEVARTWRISPFSEPTEGLLPRFCAGSYATTAEHRRAPRKSHPPQEH